LEVIELQCFDKAHHYTFSSAKFQEETKASWKKFHILTNSDSSAQDQNGRNQDQACSCSKTPNQTRPATKTSPLVANKTTTSLDASGSMICPDS